MPLEKRRSTLKHNTHALDLPPPFRPVVLREVGDAFAHACAHGAELGAGTLVFVGRFDLAEFAVVLEPDEPLAAARCVFYAAMVALADALAALAPPEKPITIAWPDTIHIDRGLIGGGRLAWPERAKENAVPDWLAFGAAIRTVSTSGEPGLHPFATALEDEGFSDVRSERLVEGFARHLMVALDRWQEGGFASVAQEYKAKLEPSSGARRDIEENGDLRIERAGKPVERQSLRSTLKAPSWLDAKTGGPRL
jgi:biotin-(acetyl-CoA carboxylase) ligase